MTRRIRCPMLRPEAGRLPLLCDLEHNLAERIAEPLSRTWFGEVAGARTDPHRAARQEQHAEKLAATDITDMPRPLS